MKADMLDSKNIELEERLKRVEKEKEELWVRAKDQYHAESERVDELIHENDNLKRDHDKL